MRQVFASPRIENVEAVAQMLQDEGIEVRVTGGRSYKGAIRGNFSYRADATDNPSAAVWIVRSEDQPRAREMLRAAGLLDSTRNPPQDSYLGASLHDARARADAPADTTQRQRAFRIRIGLLLAIGIAVALALLAARRMHTGPAPAKQIPAATSVTKPMSGATLSPLALANALPKGNTAIPDPLAYAVLRGELRGLRVPACIGVDGQDASHSLLSLLANENRGALPLSQCMTGPDVDPVVLLVGKYDANANGVGTVVLQRRNSVKAKISQRWFDVRPDVSGWRVVEPL